MAARLYTNCGSWDWHKRAGPQPGWGMSLGLLSAGWRVVPRQAWPDGDKVAAACKKMRIVEWINYGLLLFGLNCHYTVHRSLGWITRAWNPTLILVVYFDLKEWHIAYPCNNAFQNIMTHLTFAPFPPAWFQKKTTLVCIWSVLRVLPRPLNLGCKSQNIFVAVGCKSQNILVAVGCKSLVDQ